MSKTWCTASALERVSLCPASAVLPQTRSISPYSTSGAADHLALEDACLPGVEAITLTSGHIVQTAALELPPHSLSEVAFSYDVVTDKATCHGKLTSGRQYPDSSYSTIHGTADVVGKSTVFIGEDISDAAECADVVDYKTGSVVHEPDSWQMRVLAFMAARCTGAPVARSRITKVRDGQVVHSEWKLWRPDELNETAILLRVTYDAVQKLAWKKDRIGLENVTTGPHCHFCPAFLSCPAQRALLCGNLSDIPSVTIDSAKQAWAYWQRLRTLSQKMEDSLKAIASSEPIDVGGGYKWGKAYEGANYRKFKERRNSDESNSEKQEGPRDG